MNVYQLVLIKNQMEEILRRCSLINIMSFNRVSEVSEGAQDIPKMSSLQLLKTKKYSLHWIESVHQWYYL